MVNFFDVLALVGWGVCLIAVCVILSAILCEILDDILD